MYIDAVHELSIIGVTDPGVPNHERIIIKPTQSVNLAQFGIFIGIRHNTDAIVTPLNDFFFWFGEKFVVPPCWIVVYTGSGSYREYKTIENDELVHSFHWGKKRTVFNHNSIVPVIFKMDKILIGEQLTKNKKLNS